MNVNCSPAKQISVLLLSDLVAVPCKQIRMKTKILSCYRVFFYHGSRFVGDGLRDRTCCTCFVWTTCWGPWADFDRFTLILFVTHVRMRGACLLVFPPRLFTVAVFRTHVLPFVRLSCQQSFSIWTSTGAIVCISER